MALLIRMHMLSHRHLAPALAVLLLAGCTPNLSLLYVDYEIGGDASTVEARVAEAFEEAGWEVVEAEAPDAVQTGTRTFQRRILYKTIAYMEAIPIGDDFLRVFIHPFRHPFIGGRNKIPYLSSPLKRQIYPGLTEALEKREVYIHGAPRPDQPPVE